MHMRGEIDINRLNATEARAASTWAMCAHRILLGILCCMWWLELDHEIRVRVFPRTMGTPRSRFGGVVGDPGMGVGRAFG